MKKRDAPADNKADDRIKKSLRYSILDGAFYSAMVGFGESFFSAFAVFLKATNIQIGLISSLPLAIGSVLQLYSNRLIKFFNSRKRFVTTMAFLEALMYIPIMLVFFLGEFRVFHLILFVCLYWVFGMIASAAWSSWMGDLVGESNRGAYFGRRNMIAGLTAFVTFMLAGYVLERFTDGAEHQYMGFVIIFILAMVARMASFVYLTKKYEPEYRVVKKAEFSFVDFLKKARFRNFGLLVIYLCFMNFAVYIATPFFAAYMLYDLKFSYMTFTIVTAIALVVKYLAMPLWGKASDRFGTKKMIVMSGFLMPLVPFLWFLNDSIWYLLLVQVYSGLVWAGFELATLNFIFDSTSHEKRATCVAYYNVINGLSIFAGAMIGSLIIKYNNLFWSKYLLVFLASFVLRYIASFIFVPKLKEVRNVENITYAKLFLKVLTTMPTLGILHHMIMPGKKGRLKV